MDEAEADAFVHGVARDWRSTPLSEADRALCAFAAKLTHDQQRMTAADLDRLRDHGFDDRAIHDAVQVGQRVRGDDMGLLRYRTASGQVRFWTLKEIIQGRSIQRVTHPVFVVFPIAFASGALLLDVLSRFALPGAPLAASYAMLGAVGGAFFSIITGLVDRSVMRPGSKIRSVATRHMTIQLTATAIFVVDLAVRW